jgi:predicted aconitase
MEPFLGTKLNDRAKDYLKDMGAAAASNGAVGLFHVDNLTPEAKEQGAELIKSDAKTYLIDEIELKRVKENYPCIWKNPDAKPKLCFIGCPHLSLAQLKTWTQDIHKALQAAGRKKVAVPTVLTAAPAVITAFNKTEESKLLQTTGAKVSYICPLMYMNNPQCSNMPVITNSNKLRTYTSARYYTSAEIFEQIV